MQTSTRYWTPILLMVVATAAAVLSVSMGLRQSLGLFLEPMARGAGISAAAFGFAMAIQNLLWGISQPFMGGLADRYGGRTVVVVAGFAFAIGLSLMAVGGNAGLYLGGGLLAGFAIGSTSYGVLVGVVSRATPAEVRQTAVSIIAAAGSIGAFILAPVGQSMIENWGWRESLLGFAVIALSISVLAIPLDRGGTAGQSAKSEQPNAMNAIREAFAHPGYVAMTAAFFACGFQLIFIATHLPKYVSVCGLPPSVSAYALALIGLCNAFGTLLFGRLGLRFGNKLMLAMVYVLRTLAIAAYVFLPISAESTLVFAAAMGLLWLSVVPLVSGLIGSMFGVANFGILFGLMFLSHQVGAFLGAWLGGLTYDLSGSYFLAWVSLIGVGAAATLIQLLMDDRPRSRPGTVASAAAS